MNKACISLGGALLAGAVVATSALPAVAHTEPKAPASVADAAKADASATALPMVGAAYRLQKLKALTSKGDASRDEWFKYLGLYRQGSNYFRFNWDTDYCSGPATEKQPGGYDFTFSCYRHDFGYRNYKKYAGEYNFKKYHRKRIDDVFLQDMQKQCGRKFWADPLTPALRKKMKDACNKTAKTYYNAVRTAGHL
ncbi:phospholipase A2 [Streptomyces sp. NPDC047071]|uniref:phospholipase A2 n=1 Tax=Streptomyces sp. NPDC047071 TaxID=3154808 RepID=UPI003452FBAB